MLCSLLIPLILVSVALAQETSTGPSYSGSMGSVTVGDQQVYRMSLRPDIPIGKWGLALDVELFIDDQGNVDARGWEFGNATQAFDSFLRKIYYVRYGRPGEDIYFKIGALDNVTLGYGLIMADYRNTLQYPGVKKTGLHFQLHNLGPVGVEGVLNNFQDIQEGGALLGIRLSSQPAGKLELGLTYVADLDQYSGLIDSDDDDIPDAVDAFPDDEDESLDNDGDGVPDDEDIDDDNNGKIDFDDPRIGDPGSLLDELGAEMVDTGPIARKHPFDKSEAGRDFFSILGVDAAYPLVQKTHLGLKLYGQFALLLDDDDELDEETAKEQSVAANEKAEGWGIAAPGFWLSMGPLNGQLEFRHFRDDFDSDYFDDLYELDRARLDVASGRATSKDALLKDTRNQNVSGLFGRVGAELGQFLHASASYQHLTSDEDPKQQLKARASLSPHLLERVPRLSRARAYYQKNNIGNRRSKKGKEGSEDEFFESTEDTFYGYELGLEMAGGVSVVWDTRFVFEREADGKLDRKKIMTIETVFNF